MIAPTVAPAHPKVKHFLYKLYARTCTRAMLETNTYVAAMCVKDCVACLAHARITERQRRGLHGGTDL